MGALFQNKHIVLLLILYLSLSLSLQSPPRTTTTISILPSHLALYSIRTTPASEFPSLSWLGGEYSMRCSSLFVCHAEYRHPPPPLTRWANNRTRINPNWEPGTGEEYGNHVARLVIWLIAARNQIIGEDENIMKLLLAWKSVYDPQNCINRTN